ncbi:MAG: anaerobic ribonucleoside-triphosphate reductase activating protein [Elusimicrobiota bacterium]
MLIKGFIENTFIDWPGRICSVVFVPGCNYKCPFCHNSELVFNDPELSVVKEEDVFKYIETHKKWIDGIVITGGEPTLQSDLPEFIGRVKDKGLLVKLDTNGTNPELVKELVKSTLVDFIAMDIKSGLTEHRYAKSAGANPLLENVFETIKFVISSDIQYEFRTTVVPELVEKDDLINIAGHIKHAKLWTWQGFNPENALDDNFSKVKPYGLKLLEEWLDDIKKIMPNIERRN